MHEYKIVTTKDGSKTVYDNETCEHFHSIYGAFEESRHIFIENGLSHCKAKSSINILEVGFGTGLNVLLTIIDTETSFKSVNYVAVEPYPLPESIYSNLNYPEITNRQDLNDIFLKLHNSQFNFPFYVNENFILYKLLEKLEDVQLSPGAFDLIYFDAFSPKVQPELWTLDVFVKMFEALKIDGLLITYSSSGYVKKNLQAAGFKIELLPGPSGKRHITSAKKEILPEACSHHHKNCDC